MNRPEPRRDRYGRYVVKGRNGKDISYTRVTTFAKTLADTYNLNAWRCRMTALGLSRRQDLLALTASTSVDDKRALDEIVIKAQEAAKADSGRNIGSALHGFTEQYDLGTLDIHTVPEPYDADIAAYAATMKAHGLVVLTEHVEAVCVIESLGLAGTMDRIVLCPDGRIRIADVKTQQSLDFGVHDIAIQMACYANASSLYDYGTEAHRPMPDVDRTTAIVIHLPAGKGECTLHDVDIAAGWEAAQLAEQVRTWRKRKGLSVPRSAVPPAIRADMAPFDRMSVTHEGEKWPHADGEPIRMTDAVVASTLPPPLEDEVMDDARARAAAKALHPSAPPVEPADEAKYKAEVARFIAFPAEAKAWMAQHWPADVPTFKAHNGGTPLTADGLAKITAALNAAEAKFCMPFPEDDTPAVVPAQLTKQRSRPVEVTVPPEIVARMDEGDPLPADELADLKRRITDVMANKPVEAAHINQMTRDAHAAGVGFGLAMSPHRRRGDIVAAVLALAALGADDLDDVARRAVEMVLGEAQQESIPTGALLGTLCLDEAARLRAIAEANGGAAGLVAVVS